MVLYVSVHKTKKNDGPHGIAARVVEGMKSVREPDAVLRVGTDIAGRR